MNGKYESPLILASEVIGEGVYLASGGSNCRVECIYEGNSYDMNPQYKITFLDLPSSSGQSAQQADAVLRVSGTGIHNVVVYNGGTAEWSGDTIYLHLNSWSNWMQIGISCDSLGCTVVAQ